MEWNTLERTSKENGSRLSLAELAELRHGTYLLFGLLFHHPEDDQLADLVAAAEDMRRAGELARDFPFYRSWIGVLDRVMRRTEEEQRLLEEQYIDLFQVAVSHTPCPLYESAYVDRTGRLTGWITSRVEQSYAAGGLTLSASGNRELPDHAGTELEFMSLLCAQEAQAWGDGHVDEATGSLDLQKTFLEEHLRHWFPRLAQRLRLTAEPTSFYRRLADATLAFVVHDADLVGALMEESTSFADPGGAVPR